MKNKTKILITIITLALLASCLTLSSFASEGAPEAEAHESIFTTLYNVALENCDKIFSLLAFIGALVLSFAYKKGLFPFVKNTLNALSGTVKSIREEAEKSASGTNELVNEITDRLKATESVLKVFDEKLGGLEEKITEATLLNDKNEIFRAVLLAEVEMIYEIFTSSSLPQYQKDKVGEAYLRMKAALGKERENEA